MGCSQQFLQQGGGNLADGSNDAPVLSVGEK
jgi:hypothetical protein